MNGFGHQLLILKDFLFLLECLWFSHQRADEDEIAVMLIWKNCMKKRTDITSYKELKTLLPILDFRSQTNATACIPRQLLGKLVL